MSDSNSNKYSDSSNYGYTPNEGVCIAFVVLFTVSAIIHSVQAVRSKLWIVYPTLVLGALVEVMGWSGRLWSSQNVLLLTPFLMQISTLIMAPVFFSAWDYTLLGVAIRKLGPQYSILRPRYYLILFLCIDVLSLVLQAIGGGKASASAASGVPTQSATNIMVVGIIIQMVAMLVFVALALDFILRASSRRPYAFQVRRLERKAQLAVEKNAEAGTGTGRPGPDLGADSQTTIVTSSNAGVPKLADAEKANRSQLARDAGERTPEELEEERKNLRSWWILMIAVVISSVMILLRGFFRSIELSEGWSSHLATTEGFTIGLDAVPMVIAVGIFNILNPAFLLPRPASWKSL